MELRSFLLVLSLHAFGSFRISKKEPGQKSISAKSADGKIAAPINCHLGNGYGVDVGCNLASAMLPFLECADDGPLSCWSEGTSAEPSTLYYRMTDSSAKMTSLSNTIFDAEGGGYGANIGIGVKVLKESSVNQKSVGLFTGASVSKFVRTVQNTEYQDISSTTRLYINRAPTRFVQRYGLRFVDSISYGGSFLGSFVMTSKSESSNSALDVFVEMGYASSKFDAALNASFVNARSEASSSVEIKVDVSWRGGDPGEFRTGDPAGLETMFDTWSASPNWAPLTLTTSPLKKNNAISAEVLLCADQMGENAFDCFDLLVQLDGIARVAASTVRKLSSEYVETNFVDAAVRTTKGYSDISDTVKANLLILEQDILVHKLQMELMTDARSVEIQSALEQNDTSFFKAASFATRFDGIYSR